MAAHDQVLTPTHAPLLAQRRRLRERALAAFYGRHDDRTPAPAPLAATTAVPPSPLGERGGLLRRLRGAFAGDDGRARPRDAEGATPRGSAAREAALVQRLTGPGSGPYSGTPFRPARNAADAAARPVPASGAPSEAARHDHGIIDHSRHVSSLGRR